MISKLFFYDSNRSIPITYQNLIDNINRSKSFSPIIFTHNYYEIFSNIILSLIYDKPITLLDYDFSQEEIKHLGFHPTDLKKKELLNSKKEITTQNFLHSGKGARNWKVTLYTSGTTGLPKKISHSFDSITKALKVSENKKDNIWGFAYNPTHIAGLQVFFQALFNQNTIINIFGKDRKEIFNLIEIFKITNISATPTFYRMLFPFDKTFPEVKRITFGGEKFDGKLADEIKIYFPNSTMLNIYASTEAGTLFAATRDAFILKEEFMNTIKIVKNELYIHKSILGVSEFFHVENEWYNTGDLVEIISENPLEFKFIQRKNEMINVGGYKVNPSEVEEVINNHKNVTASKVYGKKNSLLGNIVIADVETNDKTDEKQLREFLHDKLQPYKIPRLINFVDKIELTRTGKLKRT